MSTTVHSKKRDLHLSGFKKARKFVRNLGLPGKSQNPRQNRRKARGRNVE